MAKLIFRICLLFSHGQVSKSGIGEGEKIRRLQAELVAVQRQAFHKEEETSKMIHHMKLENDKLKHESVVRVQKLKQQLEAQNQAPPVSEAEQTAINRVKDLEKQVICQVLETRRYHIRKTSNRLVIDQVTVGICRSPDRSPLAAPNAI